jgi:hypothetical protein
MIKTLNPLNANRAWNRTAIHMGNRTRVTAQGHIVKYYFNSFNRSPWTAPKHEDHTRHNQAQIGMSSVMKCKPIAVSGPSTRAIIASESAYDSLYDLLCKLASDLIFYG